jgi:putative ribosome biogenesis GTPase RsgA
MNMDLEFTSYILSEEYKNEENKLLNISNEQYINFIQEQIKHNVQKMDCILEDLFENKKQSTMVLDYKRNSENEIKDILFARFWNRQNNLNRPAFIQRRNIDRIVTSGDILKIVNKLTNNSILHKGNEKCSICYEEMKNKKILKLNCDHMFCSECLVNWLKEKLSCPLCRRCIK